MTENRDMVFSVCLEWFHDWVSVEPPQLVDEYDLMQWMKCEMQHATHVFVYEAFHTPRARNDALLILRALYYEYFLFQQQLAIQNIPHNQDSVERVKNAPQTPQKTKMWYFESREILSGHEFSSVICGSPSEYNAAIAKKCAPARDVGENDPSIVFVTPQDGLSPFKWGWRFEPVARDLYAVVFGDGLESVYDGLGRVRHPSLPRLGASPDGVLTSGPRTGRLLEIKCPISRELNGSVPMQYWIQMQLQAEVCDVEAVEYFEASFGSQAQHTIDFVNFDGYGSKLPYIGKICVVQTNDVGGLDYKYSPMFPNTMQGLHECMMWCPDSSNVVLENAIWWVKDYYTQTVLRNRRWWNDVGLAAYQQYWVDVQKARENGQYNPKPLFVSDDSSTSSVSSASSVISENADADEDKI